MYFLIASPIELHSPEISFECLETVPENGPENSPENGPEMGIIL